METGPSRDPSFEMDENDPVMRLLARAPMPEPDAWFATRTLARCRAKKQAGLLIARILRWAVGGGLGVSLAAVLLVVQIHPQKTDRQKDVQDAFQFMANFDADQDSSPSWQDSSP